MNRGIYCEKAEDGIYLLECWLLKGCYAQGMALVEALKNIFHTIAVEV